MRRGADVVADLIASLCPGPVFHVPGEGILDILDALATRHPGTALVSARHEGGMAFMASGAARAGGGPIVCLAARAPGALNTCLALHTAATDAVPLVLIIGQAAQGNAGREAFLDDALARVFAPIAKLVATITSADHIAETMSRALHVALSGRHGPVVLIIPEDVAEAATDAADLGLPARLAPMPDAGALAAIAARLAAAERPMLVLGGSDWTDDACAKIADFAARFDLPVATAYRRRDLFDNADPRFVGEIGIGIDPALRDRVAASDLLLVVGARLGELNTIGGQFRGFTLLRAPRPVQCLIHAHADGDELNRVYQADVAVQAGAPAMATALAGLAPISPRWGAWTQAARREREAWTRGIACPGPVDLPAIYGWLRGRLEDDAIITVGAGAYALWAQRFLPHRRRGTLLGPKSGAMGYGLPAAIGAALACPGRRAVALAGDGCFMMHGEELATAVQLGVPVVTIVLNNASYGAIRLTQLRQFGRATGTDLANPDFRAYAEAFGAHGERVTATAEFAPAFERAFAASGPSVIEVVIPAEATRPS